MPWDKADMKPVVVFECDDCEAKLECDVPTVRQGSTASADQSDFAVCWLYAQGLGWRGFKRTGHPWTYHCIKCGPAAEVAHREHKRMEAQRDRLKSKNARD